MLKIDIFERDGRWIWRVYSRAKMIDENLCACIAHGTAKTKEIAKERAIKAMNEILKDE